MDLDGLIKHIKNDGCLVRLYNKEMLTGAQCVGTFDISKKKNPIICISIKNHDPLELIRILLHEYAHYRQWKDGFLKAAETPAKGWDILDFWLRGRNYNEGELALARNSVVIIEYDAEIRTVQLARTLKVDIGSIEDYLDSAHSYASHLKNVFLTRKWSGYSQLGLCHNKLTPTEILLPLSKEEKAKLEQG